MSNVNKKIFHGKAPSWNAFADHPNLDDYWRKDMCGVLPFIQPVTVPTLNVAGWFDSEDLYGAIAAYRKYASMDPKGLNYLVAGPWFHGGWARSDEGRKLGAIDFGQNTSEWYRNNIEGPWFAYWLKGKGSINFPKVQAFRTGANKWDHYDVWPPKNGIKETRLYLGPHGTLSFEKPTADKQAHDDYVSDPAKPVPAYPRPITYLGWTEWQMYDQRFVDGRPDVLTYTSEVLTQDVTITGDPIAHLFAATTGTDSDWVVKLIDVYPEDSKPEYMGGFQFMVADEVFRARYLKSFEKPHPVVSGEVVEYPINLRSRDHTFKAGHRIMVQVQSTWFPVIDRNPQTYVENTYKAVESDFRKATQSIYRSQQFPSYIALPQNRQ